jgi:hypothetical protein
MRPAPNMGAGNISFMQPLNGRKLDASLSNRA